jgi:hypothetical protein
VVFCDSDEALEFLSNNRHALEGELRLRLPERELLADLLDKARFQALADRLGLPVPDARWLVPAATAPPASLAFPVVLKPVPRRDAAWRTVAGEAKALPARSLAELEALWPRLAAAGVDVAGAERGGQLEVRVWEQAYLRGGRFDQDAMLALIQEVLDAGHARGYPLTRLLAQMEWALEDRPGVDDLVEYETRLNYVLPRYKDPVV